MDGAAQVGAIFLLASGAGTLLARQAGAGQHPDPLIPGDVFGDLPAITGLLAEPLDFTARTAATLLRIPAEELRAFLGQHDETGAVRRDLDETAVAHFLRAGSSPFASLNLESCLRLASGLEKLHAQPGDIVLRQGDEGDSCYLLRQGSVEVFTASSEGEERSLAVLQAGMIFGEVALLTDEPRNASVRALISSDLLLLRRQDLLDAMQADQAVHTRLTDMLEWRSRPRRAAGVSIHQVQDRHGETVTVLKRSAGHAYHRLSPLGWFVYQRLDGRRQLRDLTLDCIREFGTFAPDAIQELLRSLAEGGFTEGLGAREQAQSAPVNRRLSARVLRLARKVVQWEISITGVDPLLTSAYARLFRWLFTPPALALGVVVSALGLTAFLLAAGSAADAIDEAGAEVLLFLFPAQLIAVVVHEGAHAMAVKRYRREVWRVGFGWYWFGPMAFVDTSDMWLAPRWPRIATSLAGPYADLATGAVFGIIALLSSDTLTTAVAWQLAFSCFFAVLLNLNPLLEFDGYYALSDILDRPHLRTEALAWFGDVVRKRSRPRLGGHVIDALFSVGSCAFVIVMAILTVLVYRYFVQNILEDFMPDALAAALAFVAAAVVSAAAAISLAGDVFARRQGPSAAS